MSSRHNVSGRWRLGFLLALLAMLTWATLPLALTLALASVDPWTLTWFRFLAATVCIGLWLWSRRMLVWPARGGWGGRGLLAVAAVGLTANYMLYIGGLGLTTPAITQVLTQLAPMLLGLGAMWFFGERYCLRQWAGFAVLVAGLIIFSRDQLVAFAEQAPRLWRGGVLVLLAAVVWAVYALAQKQLLKHYSSMSIMWFIYGFATLVLLPAVSPGQLWALSPISWALVAYCALNTLIAYGAFSESLNHWEASRVSAVLAVTPLGTVAFVWLVDRAYPGVLPAEHLNWVSVMAAGMVVVGSVIASLSGQGTVRVQRDGVTGSV